MLRKCTDYVNYELSVFNIGVFIAVIWVFFAWFQLIDSIHKIRFKIRYNTIILLLLILPLLTSVIGTLLPFFPWKPLPFLWYSIFWEVFTALYIIIIWLILIPYLFLKKINTFDIQYGNINYLYNNCLAKNQYIEALVFELSYFFEDFLKKYRWELKKNEWWYAHQFMRILQNQRFIDSLIWNPVTIQKIINLYYSDNRDNFSYDEEQFLQKIILGSFLKENSYLVLELNGNFNVHYDSKNGIILKNIIEDLRFLRKLNILWSSNTYNYSNNPTFANNCLNFTIKIIEEFLNKEKINENYKEYKLLYNVFKTQAHIIQQRFDKINRSLLSDLLWNNYGYKLRELNSVLLNVYWGEKYPEFKETDRKTDLDKYNIRDSNNNLLDAFAFGIFELMKKFSNFKDVDIRKYILKFTSVWEESVLSNEIEKRILILLRQDIVKNLTWWYEMVSVVFWENYSWYITNHPENIEKKQEVMDILKLYAEGISKLLDWYIYSYTAKTLQDSYRKEKAVERAEKILEYLFPKYISYNKNNHSLIIYSMDNLDYSELDLNNISKNWKITFIQKDED